MRAFSHILLICASLSAPSAGLAEETVRPAPPFRVLFGNDMTNITTCVSPYHPPKAPLTRAGIYGSIDETAHTGIDAHLLQPGLGRVPLWQSKVYPYAEHFEWFSQHYGMSPTSFDAYLLEGNDPVQDLAQRCRADDLAPFVSLRMNDHHRIDYVDFTREEIAQHKLRYPNSLSIAKYYHDHPEYRLGDRFPLPEQGTLSRREHQKQYAEYLRVDNMEDYAHPEVRAWKLALIAELAANYDLAGIELDFLRFPFYFRDNMPLSERQKIMTDFVRAVRQTIDQNKKSGGHFWLSARVPARVEGVGGLRDCGLDIAALYDAGIDFFNLGCDYVTQQQSDLAVIHQAVPQAPLYLEISHVNHRYRLAPSPRAVYRSMTTAQFYTAAHLAYARGARGVSAFNFAYYRDHNERPQQDISEPPFYVFKKMGDPAAVAKEPQHYFLSRQDAKGRTVFGQAFGRQNDWPVTWHGTPEMTRLFMDMAPPEGGWKTDGRLRVQLDRPWKDAEVIVRINGVLLKETADVSEPYPPVKYTDGLGTPETLRAWTVPAACLKDGLNTLDFVGPKGYEGRIVFVDLAVR